MKIKVKLWHTNEATFELETEDVPGNWVTMSSTQRDDVLTEIGLLFVDDGAIDFVAIDGGVEWE